MTFKAETVCPKCSPIHLRVDPELLSDELYIQNDQLRRDGELDLDSYDDEDLGYTFRT